MNILKKFFSTEEDKLIKRLSKKVEEVYSFEDELRSLTDTELKEKSLTLKSEVVAKVSLLDLKDETKNSENKKEIENILASVMTLSFALVREGARRSLNMMHHKVQLVGGMMMHEGSVAEMRTGEGKTLVATLPAYLNALTGLGVHVVTVNDYLSKRDAVWMGKVYDMLGLSVGILNSQVSYIYDRENVAKENIKNDDAEVKEEGAFKVENEFLRVVERGEAYKADIVYGTNNEFGFDYLRDNLVYDKSQLVQRGHYFAIVDEADSILIDESRTPLIISNEASDSDEMYRRFARFAEKMIEGEDFEKDEKQKAVSIKSLGIEKAEREFSLSNLYAAENVKLIHHLDTALRAKSLFIKEKQYVVRDVQGENGMNKKEVVIVDEFTGRMQPGRRWSDGLHQAIEAKEGVEIQKESKTVASITFQNYFRFYTKLAGMSGTAKTSEEEFFKVYGLQVSTIPTHNPVRRDDHADLIFQSEKGKLKALTRKIKELHEKGQPVLVGTISIEKNEQLSKYLERERIPHNILNAKNHEKEGEIIAGAGKKGSVTIATNMAGRGVDIKLGGPNASEAEKEEVNELGGLYVIGTERHEARRIDNQLRGRSGRQGDRGETQFFLSLEDDLMRVFGSTNIKSMMNKFGIPEDMPIESRIVGNAIEGAQEKIEGFHFDARKHTLQYDDVLNHQRKSIYEKRKKLIMSEGKEVETVLEALLSEIYEVKGEFVDFVKDKKEKYSKVEFYGVLRNLYLQIIDQNFMAHLEHMDHIRSSVNLRAYGQRDPLVEYKKEGLITYKAMQEKVKEDFYNFISNIDTIMANIESRRIINESHAKNSVAIENASAASDPILGRGQGEVNEKLGRNDPCPCKSGKKIKKCDCREFAFLRK